MNEDTTGEVAALRREIKRLREELSRANDAGQQGGGGMVAAAADPFGSPMRFPQLQGTISGSPLVGYASPGGGVGGQVRRGRLGCP